ncbi:MAG: putative membrane protein [Paraglaciecola sp.]|jgi:uncharacterized membrane protein
MVKIQQLPHKTVLTLSPNRSANWHQNKILILVIATVVMIIALAWSYMGVWLVLPFAGCEIALLSYLMYRVSYNSYQKQVITITPHTLMLQTGIYYPRQQWIFKRPDIHITIVETQPDNEFATTRLNLHGQQWIIELGTFLNQQDRKMALGYLQQQGLRVFSNRWWRTP